jgi:hypothetical protein
VRCHHTEDVCIYGTGWRKLHKEEFNNVTLPKDDELDGTCNTHEDTKNA